MCINDCETSETHSGIIYYLHNGDYNPRYIGQTTRKPSIRLARHKYDSRSADYPVARWIRKNNENIFMCVMETFDDDSVHLIDEREVFHIAQSREMFPDQILNANNGGGRNFGYTHTEEQKAKISTAHLGRKRPEMSAEWRENIGKSKRGIPFSEEHKAKIAETQVGEKNSFYGKTHTPETLERLSLFSHTKHHESKGIQKYGCKFCPDAIKPKLGRPKGTKNSVPVTEERRQTAVKAMHNRWHINRGIVKDGCPYCMV